MSYLINPTVDHESMLPTFTNALNSPYTHKHIHILSMHLRPQGCLADSLLSDYRTALADDVICSPPGGYSAPTTGTTEKSILFNHTIFRKVNIVAKQYNGNEHRIGHE